MNQAQWVWEYHALREKDKDNNEVITSLVKIFKSILISTLGLNIQNILNDDGEDVFTPLSMMTARRDYMESLAKKIEDDQATEAAVEDENFEKMSAALAVDADLGDMAPMFNTTPEQEEAFDKTWFTPGRKQELAAMGIKLVDDDGKSKTHFKLDAAEIRKKSAKLRESSDEAWNDIEATKSNNTTITFDDD